MLKLFIVVPCYNEEEVIMETTKRLKNKVNDLVSKKFISKDSKVLYINDGSKDKTWNLIKDIEKKEMNFSGINLSKNRGHQNALLAGLMVAKEYADIIISMDADLQDDIDAIDLMIDEYNKGFDIIYAVRNNRDKDSFFKKFTAEKFYQFMKIMGVDLVFNHADYRLISKKIAENLSEFKEVNLFLRGIFPFIGYESSVIYYTRNERYAGKTKYPLKKMLKFAWDGITSFSVTPIKTILILGIIIFIISLLVMAYSITVKLLGYAVDGWTFITCSIWLVSGVQMLSLGIIGEYIGKIYSESKSRPRYIISDNLLDNKLSKK